MKQLNYLLTAIKIKPAICLLGLMSFFWVPAPLWADGPAGLSVNLYLDQDNAERRFALGLPIELVMVVKNETQWPIITERDFSQKQFYLTLILIYTDPFDKVKVYTLAGEELHKMLSAFFIAGTPMVRSETIPQGWVKSITIDDLGALFPKLKTVPGSYKIKAELPFLRFQWGFELYPLGMLGAADHPDNYNGILVSEEIAFAVFPARGAEINVRTIDISTTPATPIGQIPIKVFKAQDIPSGMSAQQTFTTLEPVLSGTTNFDGNTDWQSGSRCLINENYKIIAKHAGNFIEESIVKDQEPGWNTGCSGFINKEIVFGQASQVRVDDLVSVSYGRVMYNRRTGQYSYTVTMVNNSDTDLQGPVWLVIADLLPTAAVISNADGRVNDNPYIETLGSGVAFRSGETLSSVLMITNPSRYRITFDDQVWATIP
jgi:hypothetical protein